MIPGDFVRLAEAEAGFPAGTLAGNSRRGPVTRVRNAVCWALRQLIRIDPEAGDRAHRFSLPVIGRLVGGRDHSSVHHAVREVEARRARDDDYRALCDHLLELAQGTTMPVKLREAIAEQAAAMPCAPAVAAGEGGKPLSERAKFVVMLARDVRERNDLIEDDHDAIGRAKGSMALAAAIHAARAAA